MPTLVESRFGNLWRSLRGERCQCFHCGEQMRVKNALSLCVRDVSQPMCCHGCLAILQTIIQNDLLDEYLANKSTVNPVVNND
ncbi:heavy metal translocating P-type ATPase metal-binding domain-containing protein [Undibacterium sp. LX40W]|nr:heavy metal translocating P-type ATPase metal-binding domain-containing protein [Undibacterium sp. LX40W]